MPDSVTAMTPLPSMLIPPPALNRPRSAVTANRPGAAADSITRLSLNDIAACTGKPA
jgi:hypothetical protein